MDLICPVLLLFTFPKIYGRLRHGFVGADVALVCFLVWSFILCFNFMTGVMDFSIQESTNGFRIYLYFISVGLYVATQPWRIVWAVIERAAPWMALVLILTALVGYSDGDFSRGGRPLSSGETLMLLQALIVMVFLFVEGRLMRRWYPVFLMAAPMVVLVQHRSVWLVLVLASVLVFYAVPRLRSVMLGFGIAALFVGAIAAFGFGGDRVFLAFSASAEEAVSSDSTFVWRVLGWHALLTSEHMDSMRKVLLGNSFGSGWARTIMVAMACLGSWM